MEPDLPKVLVWVVPALVWASAPVVAVCVSVFYFARSGTGATLTWRVGTSIHGAVIAALYMLAMTVWVTQHSRPALGTPFAFALLVPIVLIGISLVFYPGAKKVHWLQVPNVACLVWTWFMGSMAVTGLWL